MAATSRSAGSCAAHCSTTNWFRPRPIYGSVPTAGTRCSGGRNRRLTCPRWVAAVRRCRFSRAPCPRCPAMRSQAELGRGGMAVAHQARQLRPQPRRRPEGVANGVAGRCSGGVAAESERLRARLQHPGIVQVSCAGEHDGRSYFSLEFCGGGGRSAPAGPGAPMEAARGGPGSGRAASGRRLPTGPGSSTATSNRPISCSTPFPTEAYRTHRGENKESLPFGPRPDLDRSVPSALCLWGEYVVPKLTDFGLAKLLTSDNAEPVRSGEVLGTLAYVASRNS